MSSIGYRLKEERERLTLSQTAMAEAVGSTRKSQFNYETDARHPDALYLAAAAALGVDVTYVLTGLQATEFVRLNAEERQLLDTFRRGTPDVRKHVLQTIALLVAGARAASGDTAEQPPPP